MTMSYLVSGCLPLSEGSRERAILLTMLTDGSLRAFGGTEVAWVDGTKQTPLLTGQAEGTKQDAVARVLQW